MGEVIVVTDPPGAGKSTVARTLADSCPRAALIHGDDFFAYLGTGLIQPWLPEARAQNGVVIEAAAAAAGRFADGGYTVVYDGVVGPWLLAPFATATGLDHLSYVVLLPSEQECLARVAGRTGHGFTDLAATRRLHRDFAEAEVDARHLVTDPVGTPSTVARTILDRLDAGALRYGTPVR